MRRNCILSFIGGLVFTASALPASAQVVGDDEASSALRHVQVGEILFNPLGLHRQIPELDGRALRDPANGEQMRALLFDGRKIARQVPDLGGRIDFGATAVAGGERPIGDRD